MLRHYYHQDPLASVIHKEAHDAQRNYLLQTTQYKKINIPFGTERGNFTRDFRGKALLTHFTERGSHPKVQENKVANKEFGGR